jgi:transcriptional regulator with XRE-family HTH domain
VNPKQKHKNNPEYRKAFGAHFRKLREAKGYGMREFALNADMEYGTLSKIERGITNPTISTALYLADALGVPHSELFDFKFPQLNKRSK